MKRRQILAALIGLGFPALPAAARAQQQGRMRRVGILMASRPMPATLKSLEVMRAALGKRGWTEGENFGFEVLWAENDITRYRDMAAELVRRGVDVIVAPSADAALAAKQATTSVPIVTVYVTDPVQLGLIKSYARPGGNITGVTTEAASAIVVKYLQLLREALPGLSRVAILWNANSTSLAQYLKGLEMPARELKLEIVSLGIRGAEEIGPSFARMQQERVGALIVLAGPIFLERREQIVALALEYRLPVMSSVVGLVEAGGLMRYIADFYKLWEHAMRYVDAILRGANPAELAVEQPAVFDLVLNLKTARALGLTLPQSLLIRADRVIE